MQVWYERILEETLSEFRLNFGRGVTIGIRAWVIDPVDLESIGYRIEGKVISTEIRFDVTMSKRKA